MFAQQIMSRDNVWGEGQYLRANSVRGDNLIFTGDTVYPDDLDNFVMDKN